MGSNPLLRTVFSHTGISGRSLAGLIDMDPSHLCRFGKGDRGLPGQSLQPLTELFGHLYNTKKGEGPKPSSATIAELKQQANWYLVQCYPLQKKLAAMQLRYQQAENAQQLANAILQSGTNNMTPKKQRLLEDILYESDRKMKANGWEAQLKLSTAIALLQYKAKLLEEAIEQAP